MSGSATDLGLRLDDLDLLGTYETAAASYWFKILADGFDVGSAEAVKTVVASLLRDGNNSRINRHGNRVITFRVAVYGPDTKSANSGEKALAMALASASTLTLVHPDGLATSVWDVFNGDCSPSPDDLGWVSDPVRQVYVVELECYPFSRPAEKSTVTFTPGSGALTPIDDGSSDALWGGTVVSEVTWLGEDAIRMIWGYSDGHGGPTPVPFTWTGDPGSDNYLMLRVATDADTVGNVRLNGVSAEVVLWNANWYEYYFLNPGVGPLAFEADMYYPTPFSQTLYVGGLDSTDAPPGSGSFIADIGGSMRTTGGITVSRAAGLADLFVFSDPALLTSGYSPAIPGSWDRAPEGDYALWLDVSSLSSGPAFGDVIALTITGETGATQVLRTRYDASAAWIPLGLANLGGLRNATIGSLTLATTVNGVPDAGAEYRIFRREDGVTALTYYRGPAAGTAEEFIIDIPSIEHEHGGLWADGVDAQTRCPVWEYPDVKPPIAALCVLAAATSNLTVDFEYYKRSMHFNSEDP